MNVVALVGTPNAGKTTLYNWLTGARYQAVNYPGSTVQIAVGSSAAHLKHNFHVIDTPGTYSLSPKGEDEEVTLRSLFHNHHVGAVSQIIVVVDGTQLGRHIPLVRQVQETQIPVLVVVTMTDLLKRSGQSLDVQLLSALLGCKVILFNGMLGEGLTEIAEAIESSKPADRFPMKPETWSAERLEEELKRASELAAQVLQRNVATTKHFNAGTRRLDQLFLHPWLGPLIFLVVMSLLFTSIYSVAAPLMDSIDVLFASTAELLTSNLPESIIVDFIADGLVAGTGAVLVFVPQIFILFVGIGLLEASGYLARAATLVDRPLAKLGLSGRAFVPLLSGFACAVPAMMAARNLSSRRERLIANFIIPLMTCSARLPVYGLLLGLIFADAPPWKPGLALAALYIGALFFGAIAAGLLNKLIKVDRKPIFAMELPLYRMPRMQNIFVQSFKRTGDYIQRAGLTILLLSIFIWAASSFPRTEPGVTTGLDGAIPATASSPLEQSYLGQAGKFLEPIMEPMGADWRIGIGLLSAFAAREVFVSTLAIIFNIENAEENEAGLLAGLSSAQRSDGSPLLSTASICALLIFFMIAMQCLSTFAIAKKESGSLGFALTQLVVLNLVAYALAVGVFQIMTSVST